MEMDQILQIFSETFLALLEGFHCILKFDPETSNVKVKELGQRSMSHIILSIQPMHFLLISHQENLPK